MAAVRTSCTLEDEAGLFLGLVAFTLSSWASYLVGVGGDDRDQ